MKVIFHEDYYQVYTSDPAAAPGRIEAIVKVIQSDVTFIDAEPASDTEIAAVHTVAHIEDVRYSGLYPIAALAAGGAIQTARLGFTEPSFGLIRPPGHHSSTGSAWGFCYFNNMAIAIETLKRSREIDTAYVLDIDLHFGDGTVNILENKEYVTICNISTQDRDIYMKTVTEEMTTCTADIIGVSAGFDNHRKDWGGLLKTEDYQEIGQMVREASQRCNGGCFGILEGGYNHQVLGQNVRAFLMGLSGY